MQSQHPFLHPAVGKVIKAVWYEGSSRKPALASRFNDRYRHGTEGQNEKEVPEAMVTIAATVVYVFDFYYLLLIYCQIEAALTDCSNQSTASKVPRTSFTAGAFSELHTWHCNLLEGICTRNSRLYHRILSTIYKAVTLVVSYSSLICLYLFFIQGMVLLLL